MANDTLPPALEIEGLTYAYGDRPILRGIDLTAPRGRIFALLGNSGSGKTTLLNIVAGLLAPQTGVVSLDGRRVADGRRLCLPPERRGLGMVFQDYALWPHMTIARNVAFPLEMLGIPREDRRTRVARALALVGLAGFERRMPAHLSGGQQQRAALARAIVAEPSLVLFDEPLSNLDRELRESLAHELGALIRALGLTALYVTHDQSEAFLLADNIVLLRDGCIVQNASPEDLVANPADRDVASFLNLGALADAELTRDGWKLHGAGPTIAPAHTFEGASRAQILIPHHAVALTSSDDAMLFGSVVQTRFRADGCSNVVRLDDKGPEITVTSPHGLRPKLGARVGLSLDVSALRWFSSSQQQGEIHVA